jgi:hypothetical protein
MPDVTATVTVPQSKVRLLADAFETYKAQRGLDETFTYQMWLDEIFQDMLISHWRAADQNELDEFRSLMDGADDATRQAVMDVLQPPE